MLKKITPNLIVDDVNATVEWYRDILGCFEVVLTDPERGKLEWAKMACEDVEIMFQSETSIKKSIPEIAARKFEEAVILYIEMDFIKGLYNRIKDKVDIIKELHTTHYGIQEFIIKDCNGFILVFAEF